MKYFTNTANFLRPILYSFVSLFLIVLLVTLNASIAQAHGAVDQSFSTNPNSWSQACSGVGGWNGQTFTPLANDIIGFDIYFDTAGGASALNTVFSITSWPNTSNILATAPASTIANGLVHFDLPSPLAITPGQKYAIMLTGGPNTCFRTSYFDPSFFYTRGGGVTWFGTEDGALDIAFSTYFTPIDTDGDSVYDHLDNCISVSNADQLNTDGDANGNTCDTDDDNDGSSDNVDNCSLVSNADQLNIDGDANGDACDLDDDNDGIGDNVDNCILIPNVDQINTDGDPSGNACDTDDDGDGISDNIDVQPLVSTNETFSDLALGGHTAGTIQARGGYTVAISEAANPDGVAIEVTGSGTGVRIKLNNKTGVEKFDAAGSYILTDPDKTIKLQVISGHAEIEYIIDGVTYVIAVSPSSTTEVVEHDDGSVTISTISGTVTINGTTVNAGSPYIIEAPQIVKYDWSGFLQPINSDNSSIFKLGSTVPVKFQLINSSASITDAVAKLYVAKVDNGIEGSVVEATSNASADSGNTFRYDTTSHQYIFNLGTKSLTKGTYKLKIYVKGDNNTGVLQGEIDISLK
jgi:hypothetical protein